MDSIGTAHPDSVSNVVGVRATAMRRVASSNLTTEWFATVVLDLPVAIAKFKVKQMNNILKIDSMAATTQGNFRNISFF